MHETLQRASLTFVSPTVFAFGGTQVANTAAVYSDSTTAGQQQDSITQAPNTSILLYISLIFGFSLMVTVWVFFRVSGGLFNPAVSLPKR
jgi:aquaporin related protein